MTRDSLSPVREYRTRSERLIVGLMTGTSADAVDAVLVRLKGDGLAAKHEVLAELETPLPDDLRAEVLDVSAAMTIEPERLMRLDVALAEAYADAEGDSSAGVKLSDVTAIGSQPDRAPAFARRAAR
jgi:anhydro-N-acetylmuramic acid kinase